MIIGITGSSGTGKSTVCEILEARYAAKWIDADKIVGRLTQENKSYLSAIVESFGSEILFETGELNRKKLANIIYKSPERRKTLNSITFTYITAEIQKEIENAQEKLIIIDAPLLFEANLQKFCTFTIAVITQKPEIQIARIMQRDSISKEQALARLQSQHPNEFYLAKCDYSIVNEGNREKIEKQIEKIFRSCNLESKDEK